MMILPYSGLQCANEKGETLSGRERERRERSLKYKRLAILPNDHIVLANSRALDVLLRTLVMVFRRII